MLEEERKPISPATSWHLKKHFVDSNGDVYSKGKFTGYNTETNPPPTESETPPEIKSEIKVETPDDTLHKFIEAQAEQLKLQAEQINELRTLILNNPKDERPIVIQQMGDSKHKSYPLVLDIKPEDYLKDAVSFFVRGRGFLLSTYQKEGQFMHPPDDVPIYFEYYYTDPQRRGKFEDVMHYSSFTTHSKKQVEYIKNCPKFGLTIFEDVSKVVKHDREMYVMLENLSMKADGLTNERLFAQAAAMGLKDISNKSKEKLKMEIVGIWLTDALNKQKKDDETRVSRLAAAQIFGAEE